MIKRRGRKSEERKHSTVVVVIKKHTMQYAFNNALIMSRRHKMDRAFRKCLKRKEIVADYQNCLSCSWLKHIHTWGPETHSFNCHEKLNNSTDSTHIFIFSSPAIIE